MRVEEDAAHRDSDPTAQKKSATSRGCAEVPPKEEDLEECAAARESEQHGRNYAVPCGAMQAHTAASQ